MQLPRQTIKNGSLYLHTIVTSVRNAREPSYEVLASKQTVITSGLLTKYAVRQAEAFNLLNEKKSDKVITAKAVTHWKPKIVLDVGRPLALSLKAIPGEIAQLLQ